MKYILVSARYSYNKRSERQAYVLENYLHEINKRGYTPIMLSHETYSEELINNASAFLITGGFDINPRLYNKKCEFELDIRDMMDELDYKMIESAIRLNKPLLGICRGHQIINVYFGAKLIQDVSGHSATRHIITKARSSEFTNLLGDSLEVNSYHHQAVESSIYPMVEEYRSVDNIIEASSHDTLPILTVQWHPEKDPDNPSTKLIFDYFIKMIKTN